MTISPMSASVATRRRKSARWTRSTPARLAGARADQHLALVEEVELAGELARAQDEEDLRLVVVVDVEDLDRSFERRRRSRRCGRRARRSARPRRSAPRCRSARSAPSMSSLRRGKVSASRAIGSVASSAVSRALFCCASAASLLSLSVMRTVYERRAAPARAAGRFRQAATRPNGLGRDELQRDAVVAVALAGRLRAVVEDVALVAAAARAVVLGARNEHLEVGLGRHARPDGGVEARPAGAALELRLRREQRQVAAGADEAALALLVVERADAGRSVPSWRSTA